MRFWWLVILLMLAPTAAGHASPIGSDPENLSGLREPPEYISIHYTEPLAFEESKIGIYDDRLLRRDAGDAFVDPEHPNTVRVYAGNLIPGIYTVAFEMRSAKDGHIERGSLPLTIGVPCWACLDAQSVPTGLSAEATDLPMALALALATIGLALATGAWLVECLGSPRPRIMGAAGITLAGIGTAIHADIVWAAADQHTQWAFLARVTGLCIFTAGLAWRRTSMAWAGLAVTVVAWPVPGHGGRDLVAWGSHTIHLAAVMTWAGGLAALPGLWRSTGHDVRHVVLRRFSRIAFAAVLVVAVTGTLLATTRLKERSDLWLAAYGQMLALKIGLVLIALLGGALNHRRLWRGLRWAARVWSERADSGARRTIRWEAGVVVMVIVATGLLGVQSIPADRPEAAARYTDGGWVGDYQVQLEIGPADNEGKLRAGDHLHRIRLLDAGGRPLTHAHVELRFTHQMLPDIGEMKQPMHEAGNGWYEAAGSFLGALGRWEQRVVFTPPGSTRDHERVFDISIGDLGHSHGGTSIADPHFDTGYLEQGATYTRYFGAAATGYFLYHCHPHQWMVGSVLVDAAAAPVPGNATTVTIYGNASGALGAMYFEPKDLVVPPGTSVTWVNAGDMYHTATNVRWYPLDDPNRPDVTGAA